MKGLVVSPSGRIIELPILSSYKEGLNVLEYFISTHASRKGIADTALKTAVAGYLTRRLVDVSQDVIVAEPDCRTEKGVMVYRRDSERLGKNFASRVFGRVLAADCIIPSTNKVLFKKGHLLSFGEAEEIAKETTVESIFLRSPITCRLPRGVCQMCYGYDLGSNMPVKLGEAVGIVAAQAIGEPGTQLTMRTFHVGGIAGAADITMGLPRVEEIFEMRTPKVLAVISTAAGTIIEIKETRTDAGYERVVKILADSPESAPDGTMEYIVPAEKMLLVKQGEHVDAGTRLTEGSADIRELMVAAGIEATQHYIISEVQQVYTFQGAAINDKHIEVIVHQMFSRVRIKNPGSSSWTVGETVEKGTFLEENIKIKKSGGTPAKAAQLVMGISNVALTTDSFLSAASFMQTMRILTNAAIEGREDPLRGLKENVIIGRLVPAGTGFRKEYLRRFYVSTEERVEKEAE